jgi:hypothetical protein
VDGPLVFRASPLTVLFAAAFAVCATPVALTVPGMAVLYLLPIGLVFWVLRVRTAVDDTAIVVRGALRTRRVAWSEVTAIRLRTRSRISAVLSGGAELPLPAVHTRDLPLLAKASGGRLPDPSESRPAPSAPSPDAPSSRPSTQHPATADPAPPAEAPAKAEPAPRTGRPTEPAPTEE